MWQGDGRRGLGLGPQFPQRGPEGSQRVPGCGEHPRLPVVRFPEGGVGAEGVRGAGQRRERCVEVLGHPAGHHGEGGHAPGSQLGRGGAHHGLAGDVGKHLTEQIRGGRAARDPQHPPGNGRAEALAQGEGNALIDGAQQLPGRGADAHPHPGRGGRAVDEGGTFPAGRAVGEIDDTARAGARGARDLLHLGPVAVLQPGHPAHPVEVGRARHGGEAGEGLSVQAGRQGDLALGAAVPAVAVHGSGERSGAHDEVGVARPDRPEADPARGGVDQTGGDRHADRQTGGGGGLGGDAARRGRGGQHRGEQPAEALVPQPFDQGVGVFPGGHVEIGAGCLGGVGGDLAREPEADPVLAVEVVGSLCEPLGVVRLQLFQEHRQRSGKQGRAGDLVDQRAPAVGLPARAPVGGGAVHPDPRGAAGAAVGVHEPRAVALSGDPDGGDLDAVARLPDRRADGVADGGPHLVHVLFDPVAVVCHPQRRARPAELPAVPREDDGLDRGGARVDSDHCLPSH